MTSNLQKPFSATSFLPALTKAGQWVRLRTCAIVFCLAVFVLPNTAWAAGDDGIEKSYFSILAGSSLVSNSSPLAVNATAPLTYAAENESSKKVKNIITLSVFEETPDYIPGDFTASVNVRIEYGASAAAVNTIDQLLEVTYTRAEGTRYNAKKYFSFDGADYVKITVLAITAPTVSGFDTKKALILQNEMRVTRYFTLKAGVLPATFTTSTPASGADELAVSWTWPADAGNTHTQLEWTWLEDEFVTTYHVNGSLDHNLLFKNNSARVDLPIGIGAYKIPLLYGGVGKLYCRIRAVNLKKTGSRIDGPWATTQVQPFIGHNDSLNWQANTIFSEEGKRKVVIQYFDGSLRSRQTVTKDNVTNTVVTAETFYDAEGREAVKMLPVPGTGSVIAYTKNLNLFKANPALNLPGDQVLNEDPIKFFDLQPIATPTNVTPALNTASGASKYYSAANPDAGTAMGAHIPDAEGYPYSVVRYTPDASGRVMSQSVPGAATQMGKGHETKYYYGTPSQEELDGLFGTEVGNYTHYSKDMVKDANGQMGITYKNADGKAVATALAGDAPGNLVPLDLSASNYPNQAGTNITRNLLNKNTNNVKDNSIESTTNLLVPATTNYSFRYELNPEVLQLTSCANTAICYDCMYNLEIAITDESGDATPIVRKFNNVSLTPDDNCSTAINKFKDESGTLSNVITFSQLLLPGSYSIRKTLTISEASLQAYKELYLTKGLCKVEQQIIDSVYSVLLTVATCDDAPPANSCSACLTALGTYTAYRTAFLASLNNPAVSPALEGEIQAGYNNAKANCDKLCNTTSQVLGTKRTLMLADMMPFSGQYARASGSGTMYDRYNIFSTFNAGTQPFYKYPWNSSKAIDFYRTAYGTVDPAIHPDGTLTLLNATTKDDFTGQFAFSWAEALLPHHPEYDRLVFATNNLAASYNWITTFNNTTTYSQASTNGYIFTATGNLNDPFYTAAPASYKTAMATKINGDYRNGLSLWQIAYGDAACKQILNPTQKNDCYKNAPKTPPYNNLTTAQKDQVWAMFRNLYAMERDMQVNAYISASVPLGDAQTLVDQGYLLQFPNDNNQLAQQYANNQLTQSGTNNWGWYPATPGGDPNIGAVPDGSSAAQTYNSRCNSHITQWTQALLQCPAIASHASKTAIINQITAGMVAVCQKGSDENSPFGSSNVPPTSPNDGTPRSFEEVINSVFTQYGIAKDNLCNPFIIEFPKPYGKGPVFAKGVIAAIDTCNCKQYSKLKTEATAAGKDPNNLTSFNQYLKTAYGDTLTPVLFAGFVQGCPAIGTTSCYDTTVVTTIASGSTVPCQCTLVSGTTYNCKNRICTTINPYPLATAQPMPEFLKCGFVGGAQCVTCAQLSSLVTEFKSLIPAPYNAGPVFTGTDLTPANIRDNILFAQFANYRTGYQYTWLDYAKAAAAASPLCNLANYASNGSATQTVICADSKPLNDTAALLVTEPACQPVYNMAVTAAQQILQQRREYLLADFEAQYRAKCLAAVNIEQFTVNYTSKEYHYTLFYYDMGGNLVKTVPPKGVRPDFSTTFINSVKTARANNTTVTPAHVLVSNFRYNSLQQVIAKNTPDAGTMKYWFDKMGRLAVSQNAQQVLDGKYTYTLYDEQSRSIETGQKPQSTAMTQVISQDPVALNTWINTNGGTKEQITFTVYDVIYPPLLSTYMTQQNLRNRISYTGTKSLATDAMHYTATFYTYDVHGNIDTLLQDYKGIAEMDGANNRFKLIGYEYDLLSGKVSDVQYQPGQSDAFYHRYAYDAENRLTTVLTSRDKINWERDVAYTYHKHGPLARSELGQLRVQGLDNAYTLQGWFKGLNTTSIGDGTFDLGKDGLSSGSNSNVARDVVGFALHYFDATENGNNWIDYKPIGTANSFARPGAAANLVSLYNGNIGAISINNAGLLKAPAASTNSLPLLYNYRYDQMNRLVSMQAYKGLAAATNQWSAVSINDYAEAVTYDPNGNMLTYNRKGAPSVSQPVDMDALTYNYIANTNRLNYVNDAVTSSYTDDIEAQATGNYSYDANGNIKSDVKEGITSITWNVYGRITAIIKNGNTVTYTYDAGGHRLTKTANGKTTVYARDATGNLMAIYEKTASTSLKQTETYIYGSSRQGMVGELTVAPQSVSLVAAYGTATLSTFTRGEKVFEISNHVGNVLVTISDKKLQHTTNNTAVDYYLAAVTTANDYYPFGMGMPGRKYTAGNAYRFGFDGMEKDNDVLGEGNAYATDFRMYDARLGRWFSVDPENDNTVLESPYINNHDNPIQLTDPVGDDPISGIVDALIAFGLSAGSDYVGALLEGKSPSDAVESIGWWSAGWEGVKAYAAATISPPGVGIAAKIYKFSQTKVGKVVAGTVERMIDKAIANYEAGLYNDEDGNFDFDKVEFKELLLESFKEEIEAEATKFLKGKITNNALSKANGGTVTTSTGAVAGGATTGTPKPKKINANSYESKKPFTVYQMEGIDKDGKKVILEYGKTSRNPKTRESEKLKAKYSKQTDFTNVKMRVIKRNVQGSKAASDWEKGKVQAYKMSHPEGKTPPKQGRPSGADKAALEKIKNKK